MQCERTVWIHEKAELREQVRTLDEQVKELTAERSALQLSLSTVSAQRVAAEARAAELLVAKEQSTEDNFKLANQVWNQRPPH